MPNFIATLFVVSALLLGTWFAVLHALWQVRSTLSAQDPPQTIETLVQQKFK